MMNISKVVKKKYRDFDFKKTLVGVEEQINQKTLKNEK